jgi:hypothetical protein
MWTKVVLLFGAMAVASLLLFRLLPLEYFYVLPVSARAPGSVFGGLGPAVRFWLGLLAIAVVRDYVVTRRDRNFVRPFAKVLNPQPLPGDDSVTQVSDETVLSTSTSGSVNDRMATVTFRDPASRTPNVLQVDVSCNCPWVLEIRRNSLAARLLGLAGAVVATGDPDLDAMVVVQADDTEGVRDWLREPTVRSCVLSLFQQHKVQSVSLHNGGSVLRAEFVAHDPFTQPRPDATAVTATLSALAETMEQR